MTMQTSTSAPMPEEFAQLIARRFAALADPMRIRLLDALRDRGEASVGELAEALGAGQANVSKHLGVLQQQGVVARRKDGTRAIYSIADPGVLRLCEEVCGGIRQQLRELEALLEQGTAV
jgi:ArsR family transcriptional regulator